MAINALEKRGIICVHERLAQNPLEYPERAHAKRNRKENVACAPGDHAREQARQPARIGEREIDTIVE